MWGSMNSGKESCSVSSRRGVTRLVSGRQDGVLTPRTFRAEQVEEGEKGNEEKQRPTRFLPCEMQVPHAKF